MNRILLDTNILLRAADPASSQYPVVVDAVAHLLETGWECVITPQVVIEFWVVTTRPHLVNGLGWSIDQVACEIAILLQEFTLLEDTPEVFNLWMDYVVTHRIQGKRVHDIRLQAVMKASHVTHLLTFNLNDFLPLEGFVILHPDQVVSS